MSSQSKKTKKGTPKKKVQPEIAQLFDTDLLNTDPVPSDTLPVADPLQKARDFPPKTPQAPKPILKLEMSRSDGMDRIAANYLQNTTTIAEAYSRRAHFASELAKAQYEEMIAALVQQMVDEPEELEYESVDFSGLPNDVFAAMCHIVISNGWKAVLEEKVFKFMLEPVSPIAIFNVQQSPLLR